MTHPTTEMSYLLMLRVRARACAAILRKSVLLEEAYGGLQTSSMLCHAGFNCVFLLMARGIVVMGRSCSDRSVVVQLQEEKDPHHWGVDTGAIHHAMNECGIDFIRTQVRPRWDVSGPAHHELFPIL